MPESSFGHAMMNTQAVVKSGDKTVLGQLVSVDSNGVWLLLTPDADKPGGIPTNMQPLRMYFPFAQMSWLASANN